MPKKRALDRRENFQLQIVPQAQADISNEPSGYAAIIASTAGTEGNQAQLDKETMLLE